jgi:L-fuculose-phosphate aldolase
MNSSLQTIAPDSPDYEPALRALMCDLGRRMYERGYVAANDGNLSCRLGGGRFLCTPTGVGKGQMTPEMLAVVDLDGEQLSGPLPRTSEVLLHLAVYRHAPHIHAVVHAHAPHVGAFAITNTEIPTGILPEQEVLVGPAPIIPFIMNGTPEIAAAVVPYIQGRHSTVILGNHGVVGCDRTLELAYFHIETLDSYCRTLLAARQLGEPTTLGPEVLKQLLKTKIRLGIDDPRLPADAVPKPTDLPPVVKQ